MVIETAKTFPPETSEEVICRVLREIEICSVRKGRYVLELMDVVDTGVSIVTW